MKILALDSSAKSVSCAICENENLICEISLDIDKNHSKTLFLALECLFNLSCLKVDDIDLLAITNGPGSFTGLRVSLSAVKGIGDFLSLPCVTVSTLEGLAYNIIETDGLVAPVMYARCNRVYNALFEIKDKNIKRLTHDRAISISELENEIKSNYSDKKITLVGDGANLCYNSFIKLKNVHIASQKNLYSRALSISSIALNKYNNNEFCDTLSIRANYLRPSKAQREFMDKNKK